ncbi:MAG: flagellar basal body-associated FliL family protein [Myxococcota bacterium]|nr:flagellar basal body-associated FliL family protein [Myxococcota bacterium]
MADEAENEEAKKGLNPIVAGLAGLLLGAGVIAGLGFAGVLFGSATKTVVVEGSESEAITNPADPKQQIEALFDETIKLEDERNLTLTIVADVPIDSIKEFQTNKQKIQHEIILLVSDKTSNELSGRRGKMDLLNDIKVRIKNKKLTVNELYYTKFEMP